MAYSIFLSHSHLDAELARQIKEQVETLGDVSVYLSEEHVEPGRHVYEKLQKAIQEHDALVALITTSSIPSPYVNQEIGYALGLGKLSVPLVLPDANRDALAMLDGREYIELDPHNSLPGMSRLLQFVIVQRDSLRAASAGTMQRVGSPAMQGAALPYALKSPQDDLVTALVLIGVAILLIYATSSATK